MTNRLSAPPASNTDVCSLESANPYDPINEPDQLRAVCRMAPHPTLGWVVLRHADVVRILDDHETFSSGVSTHVSVPNSMDPPEHGKYRAVVEAYFTPQRMRAFAPALGALCRDLALTCRGVTNVVTQLAQPFSVRAQCAFMGWPESLHQPLLGWIADNHQATRSRDRARQATVALQFDRYIREQLDARRDQANAGEPKDITAELLTEHVDGKALSDDMLVSLIRNWTVGELGTITACVTILCHFLAQRPDIQALLRNNREMRPAAIDEILRIHAPLPVNRRVTTCPVTMAGQHLAANQRITVSWASANRDETVFGPDPDRFDLNRNPDDNVLYGRGIHVCPGAPLARIELCMLLDALLEHTSHIEPVEGRPAEKATYPAAGYAHLVLGFLEK